MKRLIAIFLALCLGVSLSSCSISINTVETKNTSSQTDSTSTDTTDATDTATSGTQAGNSVSADNNSTQSSSSQTASAEGEYVGVYKQTHLKYTDSVGNSYDAEFAVPELKIGGEDAQDANEEIREECMPHYNDSVEASENLTSLICLGINYEYWTNDNLLTLLVTLESSWGQNQYLVYTFDLNTNEELDTDDIAPLYNMTEMELESKIEQTMLDYYNEQYSSVSSEMQNSINEQRRKTVSEDNVDDADVYPNKNGELYIHCDIYSIAGAERYEYLIPLK